MSKTHNEGSANLCICEWSDLINHDTATTDKMLRLLEQAYGADDSFGILAVRNVPEFMQAKQEFLSLAHALAVQLPDEYREEKLTDPETLYNAGWSFGKEKLGKDKPADTAKGSFYYNPVTDVPGSEEDRKDYPLSYPCNLWPEEDKIPGFQEKAKRIGMILKQVTVEVSRHIDRLASQKVKDYPKDFLYANIKDTDKVKARLLYYYPLNESNQESQGDTEDSWIGWHNDSGFLTALAGEIYVEHASGDVIDSCPDKNAGLYVMTRSQKLLQVQIPDDCCAVQIGECTQIVTGGTVRATPHCVRGVTDPAYCNSIARVSLPCFVDTPPTFPLSMPPSSTREQIVSADNVTDKVPPLSLRWTGNEMKFGEFLAKTFEMYYDWK